MNDEATGPKRYGVLIASSKFPDESKLQDLSCPENDVDGLHAVLDDEGIGGFSKLLVIKNRPSYDVLRGIHRLLGEASRDDLVLIYYAGHGKLDRAGRLHLATTDTVNKELETTSVPAQRIRDLIDNADTNKTALILDCCYSGAIEKSFLRGDVDEQLHTLAEGRGTFIMTAATGVQTAREEVCDGYGIFTKHVIDGIRGGADVDGDGVITMNELYGYVHRQVRAESHQVPMKWDLNVQGELIIAQTGRKPREERRLAIRERLFALSAEGAIPDLVLTKAVEVAGLSFSEVGTGANAGYDKLLDRLLEEDFRVGPFLDDWLKVPPDAVPEPQPEPVLQGQPEPQTDPPPKHQPEPEPQPNGSQPHQPASQHRTVADEETQPPPATGETKRRTWLDVLIWLGCIVGAFVFVILMAAVFDGANISYFEYNSKQRQSASGGITGSLICAAFFYAVQRRALGRLKPAVVVLHRIAVVACLGFFLFFVALGL